MPAPAPTVKELDRFHAELVKLREPWISEWKACAAALLPNRPRHMLHESNLPKRHNRGIVDPTGTQALRIFKSGLVAIMARPSSKWFNLASPLDDGDGTLEASRWLEATRDKILDVLDRTNFYTALATFFEDAGAFGTAAMLALDDPRKVVRFQVLPVMSYAIGQNSAGRVDRISRNLTMTLRQLVDDFGIESLPSTWRNAYSNHGTSREQPIEVRHAIFPNREAGGGMGSRFLPFREVYWLAKGDGNADIGMPNWSGMMPGQVFDERPAGRSRQEFEEAEKGILRVGGYHEFPVIVHRWDRNDEDTYATGWPGLDALPDVLELQGRVRIGTNGLEKLVDPPLQGPPSMLQRPISSLPGAFTAVPELGGQNTGVRELHQTSLPPIQHLDQTNQGIRDRINRAMYVDLFHMLLSDARSTPPTAAEIHERRQEKLAALGPISERASDETFDPLIERVSSMLIRLSMPDWDMAHDGILRLPPEELAEVDVRVEYTSEVAQAQRAVSAQPIQQSMAFLGGLGESMPHLIDNVDEDEATRIYLRAIGMPAAAMRPREAVEQGRAQRAQQRQAADLRQQAPDLARAAKDLSETDVESRSALTELVGGAR